MNRILKRSAAPLLRVAARVIRDVITPELRSQQHSLDRHQQQIQRGIMNQYIAAKQQGGIPYRHIHEAGFRAYSQFEEDGILLYLFSMLGFKTRKVVEICCGTGNECMAANLILNHGFTGYLFDGDSENVRRAKEFFSDQEDCLLSQPLITQSWITAENVNNLLANAGCSGEVDLLSLDIDGNDYWVLQAINTITPRILLLETHNVIPSDLSLTVPYRPDFSYNKAPHPDFRSVSLLAMVKLCKQRGYRLIGAHRHGFNVFFLRNDEGAGLFPEVSVEEVHDNECTRLSQGTRWPKVANLPWQTI